jgi:teichoic acid transport system ATP-binding protein
MAFQMKCFKKFQEFQEQGRTILFVTHALDTVLRYCNRGIVIDAGKVVFDGTPKAAVDAFKKVLSNDFYKIEQSAVHKSEDNTKNLLLKDSFDENKELDMYGNGKAIIFDYGILNDEKIPSSIINYNSEFQIIMKVKVFEMIQEPIFAFTIKDSKGLEITGTNTTMKYIHTGNYKGNQSITISFTQKANLQLGSYALSLGCVGINETGIEVYNRIYDAIIFDIIGSEQMVGFFDLQSTIQCETSVETNALH